MYRIWYWAVVSRESDGRFVVNIPDLANLAAWGGNEKHAVSNVTELAAEHVRTLMENGQPVPPARPASEMPNTPQANKIGRALIPVPVGRAKANAEPVAPF